MSDLDQAALMLAGFTAAFLLLGFAVWWMRRPRPEPAAPRALKTPHSAGETRLYERNVIDMLLDNLDRLARGDTNLRNGLV